MELIPGESMETSPLHAGLHPSVVYRKCAFDSVVFERSFEHLVVVERVADLDERKHQRTSSTNHHY